MLNSGDAVDLEPGIGADSEAGLVPLPVVVTAQRTLVGDPAVIQVVPLTGSLRDYA